MAAISLFWNSNMAAVTWKKCEHSLSLRNLVPGTSRLPRPLDAILSDMVIWSTLASYEELTRGFESIKIDRDDWDDRDNWDDRDDQEVRAMWEEWDNWDDQGDWDERDDQDNWDVRFDWDGWNDQYDPDDWNDRDEWDDRDHWDDRHDRDDWDDQD